MPQNVRDARPQRGKTGTDPAATSKSVLPKMKASWDQTFQRAAETGTTMALPQHTKEVIEKAAKREEDILSPGKVGGTEIQAILGKQKAGTESTPAEAPAGQPAVEGPRKCRECDQRARRKKETGKPKSSKTRKQGSEQRS